MNTTATIIDQLTACLGDRGIVRDEAKLARYATDWSGEHVGRALAIVRPGST